MTCPPHCEKMHDNHRHDINRLFEKVEKTAISSARIDAVVSMCEESLVSTSKFMIRIDTETLPSIRKILYCGIGLLSVNAIIISYLVSSNIYLAKRIDNIVSSSQQSTRPNTIISSK